MQAFNFDIRNSTTPSVDDTRSRYVPSSIYSGPGPAEESPLPAHPQHPFYVNGNGNGTPHRMPSQMSAYMPYEQRFDQRPAQQLRASTMLNVNDPVSMHLLMETAIHDSKEFEILSFEELEQLKTERLFLRKKVEGVKRQYALEKKMHEAGLLMNKLTPPISNDRAKRQSSIFSRKPSSAATPNEDLSASSEKLEHLAQEVTILQTRLQEVDARIMQHTAGILQFTHRGLKKNIRKNELPRSPESMASQSRSMSRSDGTSDFDENSLYQVPDYVHEYAATSRASRRLTRDIQPIEDVALRLHTINTQVHGMLQQVALTEYFEPPPEANDGRLQGKLGAQIQAHLTYLAQGLEALSTAQQSVVHDSHEDSVDQLNELTSRLEGMLESTNSVSRSPIIEQDPRQGDDLQSQLAYSATVLDRLDQRVGTLLEQKDILTRQIQQQRELNSKSDAQRDAHIRDLTEELEEAKNLQAMSEKEMQQTQAQVNLLMEQLDKAKRREELSEKQMSMQDNQALESERNARKESEAKLIQELELQHHTLSELQADHAKMQNDFELKLQHHTRQLNDATTTKDQAELELKQKNEELEALQKELQSMETQVVQSQTELTMARAELDSAYGSRAQRAADVSMNPDIKKQIDELVARNTELTQELDLLSQAHETKGVGSAELQNKVNSLQKELKDTIEDYEVMTKANIDAEKERDRLEATVDELRAHCDSLKAQLNEDQVKWIGVKNSGNLPPETTSTMVLKSEFKKMMRDSRAESLKVIKVSIQ